MSENVLKTQAFYRVVVNLQLNSKKLSVAIFETNPEMLFVCND